MAYEARTIAEIYNAIITEKQSNTNLSELQPSVDTSQTLQDDLSSQSKVAVWRLIYYTIAVAIHAFEVILAIYEETIDAKSLTFITGTDLWYSEVSKTFQLGDELVWNGVQYAYPEENEDKQIIEYSSAKTTGNLLKIKVAKDSSGTPAKLSASELSSFTGFIDKIVFSGTSYSVVSTDSDYVKLVYTIVYDPLVLAPDGESIETPGTYPVEDAINDYLANLDFAGVLRVMELTDAVQVVDGVNNAIATTVEAKQFGGSFLDVLATVRQEYEAFAGWSIVDPAFPLSSQLNYVAQ